MAFSFFKRKLGSSNPSSKMTNPTKSVSTEDKNERNSFPSVCNQNENIETVQETIQTTEQMISCVDETRSFISENLKNITEVYHFSKEVEQNIAKINSEKELGLQNIIAKYELSRTFLVNIFGERDKALSKNYAILDQALEKNDRELIIVALKGISSIVVKSPLEDLTSFIKAWDEADKNHPLELEF